MRIRGSIEVMRYKAEHLGMNDTIVKQDIPGGYLSFFRVVCVELSGESVIIQTRKPDGSREVYGVFAKGTELCILNFLGF